MRRRRILTIPRSTGDTLHSAPAMSTSARQNDGLPGAQCASLLGFDGFPVRDRSSRGLLKRAPEAGAEEKRQDCADDGPRSSLAQRDLVRPASTRQARIPQSWSGRAPEEDSSQSHMAFSRIDAIALPGRTLMKTLIPAAARVHGRGGPSAWLSKVFLATRMARSTG